MADNTRVAAVCFRESQGVAQTFFPCKRLFFQPPPCFLEALFFPLLLCFSSQWPLLKGRGQTLGSAEGLSATMVSFGLEQKLTDAAHTQQHPPPQKK